jgi:hypothetical protein
MTHWKVLKFDNFAVPMDTDRIVKNISSTFYASTPVEGRFKNSPTFFLRTLQLEIGNFRNDFCDRFVGVRNIIRFFSIY